MFKKSFLEMRTRWLIFIFLFCVVLTIFLAMRPFAGEMMAQFEMSAEQLEKMPEFFREMLGETSQMQRLKDDDQYYLMSQWYAKNFGQFLPFFALIMAFPVFSREVEKKTIYFLLAKMKRSRVFELKAFPGLLTTLVTVAFFSLVAPFLMILLGYDVRYTGEVFLILFQQLIGAAFFYALFLFFSVCFNDQIKPVIIGIIISIGLPFFSLVNGNENWPGLSWLNPYPYIQGSRLIQKGEFDVIYTLALALTGVLLLALGYVVFKKKEF